LIAPKAINPMKKMYEIQVQQALSACSSVVASPLTTPRVTPIPTSMLTAGAPVRAVIPSGATGDDECNTLFNAIASNGNSNDGILSTHFLQYLNDSNSRSPSSTGNSLHAPFNVLGNIPARPDSQLEFAHKCAVSLGTSNERPDSVTDSDRNVAYGGFDNDRSGGSRRHAGFNHCGFATGNSRRRIPIRVSFFCESFEFKWQQHFQLVTAGFTDVY
uniref:Zinc finger protein n=1 Tax=Heligmosomoides polygyrus TaxID=6339 RepID=A0A183GBL2_HELPZ